jgi:hypothetical protein
MERPQSPYYGMPLEELTDAMHARAGELQARRSRSPEEREQLAADTALMLLSAAAAITPGHYAADTPEREMDSPTGFQEAFARWNDQLVRGCRYRVLVRAANAALGGRVEAWIRDGRVGGQRAYDLALAELEAMRSASR